MTTYTAEDAREAVARGAQWLDEKCPDWTAELDLAVLDLKNPYVCVLGQTAECILGRPVDGPGFMAVTKGDGWATRYGFDVPLTHDSERNWVCSDRQGCARELNTRYEMLQISWIQEIRERLAAGAVK